MDSCKVFCLAGEILLIGLVYSVLVCMIDFKRSKKLKGEVNTMNKAFFDVESGYVDSLQSVDKHQQNVKENIQIRSLEENNAPHSD